jgi:hypothetical protein
MPMEGDRHEPGRREQPGVLGPAARRAGSRYALPTSIALIRRVESITTVLILNLFALAWPAAPVMACMLPRPKKTTTDNPRVRC